MSTSDIIRRIEPKLGELQGDLSAKVATLEGLIQTLPNQQEIEELKTEMKAIRQEIAALSLALKQIPDFEQTLKNLINQQLGNI